MVNWKGPEADDHRVRPIRDLDQVLPRESLMSEGVAFWLTLFWFALTYLGLALGRLPGLRTDRAGVALVGAAGVLGCGLLSFEDAVKAVDFATLVLLLGMMVVVAFLRRSGFFARLAGLALGRVRTPKALLAVTMLLSGVLSAVLVNDVVCLALAPLVLHLTRRLGIDPRPHLVGLAVASNLGSAATLTGNPQNMIIGGLSGIPYLRFAAKLAPAAVLGLVVGYVVALVAYRSVLRATPLDPNKPGVNQAGNGTGDRVPDGRRHTALLVKSLLVTVAAVGLFFAGFPMARGRPRGRRGTPARPGQAGEGVRPHRLGPAGHVRRAVRRRAGVRGPRPGDVRGGRMGGEGRPGLDAVRAVGGPVESGEQRAGRAVVQAGDSRRCRRRRRRRRGWPWRYRVRSPGT